MASPLSRHANLLRLLVKLAAFSPLVSFAGTPLGDVEVAAADWAHIEAESVKVEQEWSFGKPFLENLLAERNLRLKELNSKLLAARANGRKNAEDQAGSRERIEAAHAYLAAADVSLNETVAVLQASRSRLPPRLSDSLELSYRTMGEVERPISERWQAVTVIVNRCFQFNHTIVKAEELLQVEGAAPRLVETIYWGLAQGYALDRAENRAWRGSPEPGGWKWEPFDGQKPLAHALAIYSERADPYFMPLDAKLLTTGPNQAK
jgi:hypothetical protein